ncbi:MAG: hypothetical protein K2H35_06790, partial [Muribaculaceae bacterium]|nr:hypothetical protein [Muribaculaceae bacterium]
SKSVVPKRPRLNPPKDYQSPDKKSSTHPARRLFISPPPQEYSRILMSPGLISMPALMVFVSAIYCAFAPASPQVYKHFRIINSVIPELAGNYPSPLKI